MTTRPTLLLVEDNPGDSRLVEELVGDTFTLHKSADLAAGIALLATVEVDVVLTDLGLPDADGIDVVHTLGTADGDTPIVVLTGLENEATGLQAVREGAQDYLFKSELTEMTLRKSLRYAIERHALRRELAQMQQQVLQSERDRVVMQTAGAAAHEINNPLALVMGEIEMLRQQIPADTPLRERLESAYTAALRIRDIVRDMRALRRYATKDYPGSSIVDFASREVP